MSAQERALDRAARRGRRALITLGEEFHDARLGTGWSQARVGAAVGTSRSRLSRIEGADVPGLSILEAARIAGVLGLDLSVRLYPGAGPLRDEAHARRLDRLLGHVRPPLRVRREVPLPAREDRPEHRAWDATLQGHGFRTAIELEMRIRDAQATERRLALKRRDDPPDALLLVVAATRANRRVLAEYPTIFAELPRLSREDVLNTLSAGRHPPTGLVLA